MLRSLSRRSKSIRRGFSSIKRRLTNKKRLYSTKPNVIYNLQHINGQFPSIRNKFINFLPSGYDYVIERFGKFSTVRKPGLNILIPFIDRIAYVVDNRELCLRIDPERATTEDNVMVKLGGNLYIKFYNPENAAYGAFRPIYAVSQYAQSVMRTAVGDIELDKLFKEKGHLNLMVKKVLRVTKRFIPIAFFSEFRKTLFYHSF